MPGYTASLQERFERSELAYAGHWRVEGERAIAGRDARLRLRYRARATSTSS